MTKGLGNTLTYVSDSPTMKGDPRAAMYRFGYVILTKHSENQLPIYEHWLTNSSTLIDNMTRQVSNGEKFLYGQPVLDYPRNRSGNATSEEEEKREAQKKPAAKVKEKVR